MVIIYQIDTVCGGKKGFVSHTCNSGLRIRQSTNLSTRNQGRFRKLPERKGRLLNQAQDARFSKKTG
jgi:hypothetical protein